LLPRQLTRKEKSPWWGQEEFCVLLGELVQEFKGQLSFLRREADGLPIDESLLHDYLFRYERHRGLLKEMQVERQLLPSYIVVTALSREVSFAKLQENHALNGLFNLVEQQKIDYLRKCDVCQCWFLATRSDQVVCSKACRQKKYCANPEYNQHRREIYAWKKTHKAKKAAGTRKNKYA
jgi:hypothetical protein